MFTRAVAHINLAALQHNYRQVKRYAPYSKVMAMVKGNAYGHGMVPVAKALAQADYFGVATLEEAMTLRVEGIVQPIVLMSGVYEAEALATLVKLGCQMVIHTQEQLELLQRTRLIPTVLWIKVDTGMHRYGFNEAQARTAYEWLKAETRANLRWLSHFACADQAHSEHVAAQLQAQQWLKAFAEPKSFANSAAIIQYPNSQAEVVRPGLMLYGASPCQQRSAEELGLLPVMTLRAKVVAVHELAAGEAVGYGATWRAQSRCKIAVVSLGYADGYPQAMPSGTPVLVRGQRACTVGRVSMDAMTIDVSEVPHVALGDEVTLWGDGLPVEAVADAAHGSVYGLLTGITQRAHYDFLRER